MEEGLSRKKVRGKKTIYNPSVKQLEIFRLLSNQASVPTIKKIAKCSDSDISKAKERFVRYGYMVCRPDGNFVLPDGKAIMEKALVQGLRGKILDNISEENKARLHNIQFTCPLRWEERNSKKWKNERQKILKANKIEYDPIPLNHHIIERFVMDEWEIRTTTRSVLITGKEFFGYDGQDCKNKAIMALRSILPKIEKLFNIHLDIPNRISVYVSRQEIAYVQNTWAKEVLKSIEEGKVAEFKVYNEEGDVILHVDNSFDMKELECVHTIEAEEHSNELKAELSHIVTGRTRDWRMKTNKGIRKADISIQKHDEILTALQERVVQLTEINTKIMSLLESKYKPRELDGEDYRG